MDDESSVPDAPSVEQLLVMLAERDRVIAELTARVAELEARLGKNSQNSSKPPSSDAFVKPPPRSLRKKTGRKPGKQNGDPGSGLERRDDPDEVITHPPVICGCCGEGLAGAPVVGEQVRQVFDLPPVRVRVVEHRVQRRRCRCGRVTAAEFPSEARAPTCYGPEVAALGTYLLGRQHLPVERAAELMGDLFGVRVSTGWLSALLPAAQSRLADFVASLRERLRAAPVAHFDETGGRVGAKLCWIHVAATSRYTLYHLARGRGKISIDAGAVLPDFVGVAVHDGLTSYRRYDVEHALCGAHHLRELAGIGEATGQDWPVKLADLLVEIHQTVQAAKTNGDTALSARRLAGYRRRYQALITEGQQLNPPPPRTGKRGRPRLGPAGSLLRRLHIYQDDVLRFAYDFDVAFDNNQAERDVRMVKLQQKISGGWRTEQGAKAFLDVRSYLSTARKHNQNAIDVLRQLFTDTAWIPAPGPAP
ncbi:MAG: IS66 family transposase [Pseudonocardiaceae bacterium]